MKATVLVSVAVTLLCSNALAAAPTIYGLGQNTCGSFVTSNAAAATEYRDWLLGYLSALAAAYYPQDILKETSPAAALAWLKDYCKAHSLDGLGYAGTTFMNELLNRVEDSKRGSPAVPK